MQRFVLFFSLFFFFSFFGINSFRMNGVLEECWVFSVGWIFYPSPNWLFFYFGITGMRTTFSVFGVTWQKTWKNDFSLHGTDDVKRPQIFPRISCFFFFFFFFIKSDTGLKYSWSWCNNSFLWYFECLNENTLSDIRFYNFDK